MAEPAEKEMGVSDVVHGSPTVTACEETAGDEHADDEKVREERTERRSMPICPSIHSIHSTHSTTPSEASTATATATATGHHDGGSADDVLRRTITPKDPLIKVPRAQRRGLFARFALIAEVTEPKDYSARTQWFITFVVAMAAAAAPIGSATILPSLQDVTRELHTTPATTNLSVALYMLSMAIFPLWWSAYSEASGRRTVFIASFTLFILFAVLSAVATSIAMLIVMRMLAGGAAASVQAVGAGTLADLWPVRQRGRAMGIFYLGPLCGPLFAPIIGGILGQRWGWRATQWALVVFGVVVWVLVFLALPETLARRKNISSEAARAVAGGAGDAGADGDERPPPLSRVSTREVVQQKSRKYWTVVRMLLLDPLRILAYLRFTPVLLTIYYSAVTFGSLYILNVSIQYTFERRPYDFPTIIVGLLYIPNSLGYMLASIFGGRWMDAIMKREALKANRIDARGKLIFLPEDRMRENAWMGALIFPAALIIYGWTVQKGVIWVVPMISNFFYGIGSMMIFAMSTTMLTEFMPNRSSSGVALNNLCRNILSAAGAVVAAPLIDSIGNGWLFTILGLWTLSSCSVIWAMKRFGPRWRTKLEREFG